MATTIPIKQWTVGTVAVVAIAASVFFVFHKPADKEEQSATKFSETVGSRAGEEVAQLIGHKGQVAVIEMEFKAGQTQSGEAGTELFRQTLKKHDITVVRTKKLPGGLSALVMGGGVISWNDYQNLVQGPPVVDAVITFAKLPDSSAEELHQFQMNHPPLVAVDIFGMLNGPEMESLVAEKTVALAVMPRSTDELLQKTNEPENFEHFFRILRPPAK